MTYYWENISELPPQKYVYPLKNMSVDFARKIFCQIKDIKE